MLRLGVPQREALCQLPPAPLPQAQEGLHLAGLSPKSSANNLGHQTGQFVMGACLALGLPWEVALSPRQGLCPNTCHANSTLGPSHPARPIGRMWTSRAWAKLCIPSTPLGDLEKATNPSSTRHQGLGAGGCPSTQKEEIH